MDTYVGSRLATGSLCCSYKIHAGANMFHKCIALRTIVPKDGVVYLSAGGGIVFDSVNRMSPASGLSWCLLGGLKQ
jgi:hypothetical protein